MPGWALGLGWEGRSGWGLHLPGGPESPALLMLKSPHPSIQISNRGKEWGRPAPPGAISVEAEMTPVTGRSRSSGQAQCPLGGKGPGNFWRRWEGNTSSSSLCTRCQGRGLSHILPCPSLAWGPCLWGRGGFVWLSWVRWSLKESPLGGAPQVPSFPALVHSFLL